MKDSKMLAALIRSHRAVPRSAPGAQTSVVALISLGISITTAGFTFFQWWNTQHENQIKDTIELSKAFLKDDNDSINKITQRLWDESDSNFTGEEIKRLEIALSRLEYI